MFNLIDEDAYRDWPQDALGRAGDVLVAVANLIGELDRDSTALSESKTRNGIATILDGVHNIMMDVQKMVPLNVKKDADANAAEFENGFTLAARMVKVRDPKLSDLLLEIRRSTTAAAAKAGDDFDLIEKALLEMGEQFPNTRAGDTGDAYPKVARPSAGDDDKRDAAKPDRRQRRAAS